VTLLLLQKFIYFLVGLNEGIFSFYAFPKISVLHAENELSFAGFGFVVNVFEDIFVIDLAGGWLLSAGLVPDLEITDFVPDPVDVLYKPTFVFLHVVDIVKDFAGGASHRLTDHVTLVRMA